MATTSGDQQNQLSTRQDNYTDGIQNTEEIELVKVNGDPSVQNGKQSMNDRNSSGHKVQPIEEPNGDIVADAEKQKTELEEAEKEEEKKKMEEATKKANELIKGIF